MNVYKSLSRAFVPFVLLATAAVNAQGETLALFVGNGASPSAADQVVIAKLLSLGHDVNVYDDDDPISVDSNTAAIIVSSSVAGPVFRAAFRAAFRDDPRPILLWEQALYDHLGLTGPEDVGIVANVNGHYGAWPNQSGILLLPTDSPISAGLATGNRGVTAPGVPDLDIGWGAPSDDAVVVARLVAHPHAPVATIFTHVLGDQLRDGGRAAGKRIGFFMRDQTASYWEPVAQQLFEGAIAWMLELEEATEPTILTQPYSENVAAGATAVFTVLAGGYPAPTYQWQRNGVDLPGETAATLSFEANVADHGNSYRVVVTNSEGSQTSAPASLNIIPQRGFAFVVGALPLSAADQAVHDKLVALGHIVTTHLHDQLGSSGSATSASDAVLISSTVLSATVGTATFRDDLRPVLLWESGLFAGMGLANDVQAIANQNQISQIDIADDTSEIGQGFALGPLHVNFAVQGPQEAISAVPGGNANIIATQHGATRAAVFTYDQSDLLANGTPAAGRRVGMYYGDLTPSLWTAAGEQLFEQVITWMVGSESLSAPVITAQPVDSTVVEGETATFTVLATGNPAPTYQWRKDGVAIADATGAILSFTAQVADAGDYDVVVTSPQGSVTSGVAALTVTVIANDPPVITLIGDAEITIAQDDAFTDPGATANDAQDGDLTSQIQVAGTVDVQVAGIYTITYSVTDADDNTVEVQRTVTVEAPAVDPDDDPPVVDPDDDPPAGDDPPVITLTGNAQMTITQGASFTDPGATATDAQDGDLTSQIQVAGTVNAQVAGTYTLTYSVTDTDGNSVEAQRTVTVTAPPAPPPPPPSQPSSGGGGGSTGIFELLMLLLLTGGIARRKSMSRPR